MAITFFVSSISLSVIFSTEAFSLIILETVVPGGVVGTVGVILLLAAVIITSKHHGGTAALVVMAVSIVGSLVALAVAWHYLPRTSFGNKLFLTPSTSQGVRNISFASIRYHLAT